MLSSECLRNRPSISLRYKGVVVVRQKRPDWAIKKDRDVNLALLRSPRPAWHRRLFEAAYVILSWIGCFLIGSLLLWIAHLGTCHPSGGSAGCGPIGGMAEALLLFGAFGAPLFIIAFIGCLLAALIAFFASRR
jgi:hypothetical protein